MPESNVGVPLPLNVTVLLPGANVPPVTDQLPDTFNAPDGAVNTPEESVTFVAVILPVDPLNVPPLMVSPLLNV